MNQEELPEKEQLADENLPVSQKDLRTTVKITVLVAVVILVFAFVLFSIPSRFAGLLSSILVFLLVMLLFLVVRRLSIPLRHLVSPKILRVIAESLNTDSGGGLYVLLAITAIVAILLGLSLFASTRDKLAPGEPLLTQSTFIAIHTPTVFATHSPISPTPSPTATAIQTVIPTVTPTPLIMFKRKPTPTADLVANLTATQTPLLRNPTLIRPRVLIADVRHFPSKDAGLVDEEYILLVNFDQTVDITGWTASLDSGEIYRFENYTIPLGSFAKVHTVGKRTMSGELSWNLGVPLWKRSDYRIILRDGSGSVVDQFEHTISPAAQAVATPETP